MKQFMAVFFGGADGYKKWQDLDEKTRKAKEIEGMASWHAWVKNNSKSLVGMGSPLGKTKRIDRNGISDMKNEIGAYSVVQAETHEDAAKLFLNHPHFSIFPGDRVELMECMPIPGMDS
jgi:hypothetical protein